MYGLMLAATHRLPLLKKKTDYELTKMKVAGMSRDHQYLLVIHDSRSDLRGLVTRCAFHPQHPLMERLTRDSVVR